MSGRTLSKLYGRLFQPPEAGEEPAAYSPAKLSSPLWRISHALGVFAGCIFAAGLVVFLLGRSWNLQRHLDMLLPDQWFRTLGNIQIPRRMHRLRDEAARDLRQVGKTQPGSFGLGSTTEEVLSVQGKPDEMSSDTWHYGQSEVYFQRGRVVGWRMSETAPLKAR